MFVKYCQKQAKEFPYSSSEGNQRVSNFFFKKEEKSLSILGKTIKTSILHHSFTLLLKFKD